MILIGTRSLNEKIKENKRIGASNLMKMHPQVLNFKYYSFLNLYFLIQKELIVKIIQEPIAGFNFDSEFHQD